MDDDQQITEPVAQAMTPELLQTDPADKHITFEDMIAEDIDDKIPELPIEEAKKLYDISFKIATIKDPMTPLKHKDNTDATFETRDEAVAAIKTLGGNPDDYTIIETRSLKPDAPRL